MPESSPTAEDTPSRSDQVALLRVVDAAANRVSEGLRVAEDVIRFVWDDAHLCRRIKQSRHQLGQAITQFGPFNPLNRMRARDTLSDVGTDIRTAAEVTRADAQSLVTANLQRAQEALRTLAECSKAIQPIAPPQSSTAETFEQVRYDLYTLQKAITITVASCVRLEHVRICALVSAKSQTDLEALVRKLVAADVGMIQLREKNLPDAELLDRARLLRQLTDGTKTISIINDRPDIAAAVAADGVHLGQDDMPISDARKIVGTASMIGISTHDLAQAQQAVLNGADYLGVGPTFPSHTKSFDQFAGLEFVASVAKEIRLPAFAIGGISEDNVADVAAHGLNRIAVQQVLADTDRCAEIVKRLRSRLSNTPPHIISKT